MSAATSSEEKLQHDGNRDLESSHKCSEMLLLTSEDCSAHRNFLIDLLPGVVEEASAAMEGMLSTTDWHLNATKLAVQPAAKKQTDSDESAVLNIDEDFGIDVDDEDGKSFGTTKCDVMATGVLQRQTSLKACGKLMDMVSNPSTPLLNFISREKSFNERCYDTPNARWRKGKRAALFDSRRVVLVFSILSSVGTLVLIYLTLRIRQAAESFVGGG